MSDVDDPSLSDVEDPLALLAGDVPPAGTAGANGGGPPVAVPVQAKRKSAAELARARIDNLEDFRSTASSAHKYSRAQMASPPPDGGLERASSASPPAPYVNPDPLVRSSSSPPASEAPEEEGGGADDGGGGGGGDDLDGEEVDEGGPAVTASPPLAPMVGAPVAMEAGEELVLAAPAPAPAPSAQAEAEAEAAADVEPFAVNSLELQRALLDDWRLDGSEQTFLPGETLVMRIEHVQLKSGLSVRAEDAPSVGTLLCTNYQIFHVPARRSRGKGHCPARLTMVPVHSVERLESDYRQVWRWECLVPTTTGGSRAPAAGESATAPPPSPVKYRQGVQELYGLTIYCKDMRCLRLGFPSCDLLLQAERCLKPYVFPSQTQFMFAYYYALGRPVPPSVDGWRLYDPQRELRRMGALGHPDFQLCNNGDFGVCSTYAPLFALPAGMSVSEIRSCASFRSRERLPVLSWKHPLSALSLWRCSQPRVGINNQRNSADEKLVKLVAAISARQGQPKQVAAAAAAAAVRAGAKVPIWDCRPKLAAMGNKVNGKGYEGSDVYRSAKVSFMNIPNIHVVRDAYKKLHAACGKQAYAGFLSSLSSSNWYGLITELLRATFAVVRSVDMLQQCGIVHCSDGWDRTSQLVALAQLCLDPFFRTTTGFFTLIDKEFVWAGHKFHERCGHRSNNHLHDQRSPVFLQFLDCVFQLLQQFPTHFEFNDTLLVAIADHLHSGRFGTFLFDCERQRRKAQLRTKTVSLWTYLLASPSAIRGEFKNPFFDPVHTGVLEANERARIAELSGAAKQRAVQAAAAAAQPPKRMRPQVVMYPSFSQKKIVLWASYFLRWNHAETFHHGVGTGRVPPYGAVVTSLLPASAFMERKYRDALKLIAQLRHRVRQLEGEKAGGDSPAEGRQHHGGAEREQQEEKQPQSPAPRLQRALSRILVPAHTVDDSDDGSGGK